MGNGILLWFDLWEFVFQTALAWLSAMSVSTYGLHAVALAVARHMGMTLQLSLAADAIGLVTWSSSWVFLYFSKLNAVQFSLLSSLLKLFLGKKNNVLRKRVDSCDYDVNQLLLGTLLFTILVFLVTTNSVFFVFFSLVRFSVWACKTAVWLPIVLVRCLPLASMLYRSVLPSHHAATFRVEAQATETRHHPSTPVIAIPDVWPTRRRPRDHDDQRKLRRALEQGHRATQSVGESAATTMTYDLVLHPASFASLFVRLRQYMAALTQRYSSRAVLRSCLFGEQVPPVAMTVLFEPDARVVVSAGSGGSSAKSKTE
ncbi:hypothetical protein ATCC90586_006456 [Pythium insidiosum]|nr:hypothetical protein ATCC90586_006456 [Pythium insidiosum]